ncbi:MAG TPA: DNA polymerase III subunit epsilon [Parvularcula sp.]|nr:DNA polymerase III subunit epsilon [Parvularcula sp.]HBS31334.1 DNA polymerase III subunit epsilon [Parvularcula sp.]
MRQVVFDLETTGFRYDEGHRIVEIGAIELMRGAITGKSFHAYVNPERDVPDGAVKVHGLTQDFLRKFPVFSDARVADAFLAFAGDAELVAHNGAAFDVPFINAELTGAGRAPLANELIDTLLIARRKYPGAPASLDALCQRFGIDTADRKRDGHGALLDSRLLAAVYIELTGGAQAGLDFDEARAPAPGAANGAGEARGRTRRIAPLLTEAERAAHEAFVRNEIAPNALWRRFEAR